MTDSLLSRFADFVIYLLPGLLLVLSAIYRFAPDRLRHPEAKLGLGELALVLAGAYLVGMVTFRLSDEIVYLLDVYYGENPMVGIIQRFPELGRVSSSLQQQLGINTDNPVTSYRYAAAIVLEKSPHSAEAAERLMALGHLFRNLLICMPIALLLLSQPLWRRFRWKGIAAAVACASILEYLFLKTFLEFWSSGIWKYLRAYLVWSALK
jgi:hypothetical protein